jgi:fructose-1,6-bisphosphatase/inositol monophosphatase family enzyme
LHAFWVRRICCWDAAAGILIAREAGATVGPLLHGPAAMRLDDPAFIAASTRPLYEALRDILR